MYQNTFPVICVMLKVQLCNSARLETDNDSFYWFYSSKQKENVTSTGFSSQNIQTFKRDKTAERKAFKCILSDFS